MDAINDEIKRLESEGVAEEVAQAAADHEENNPPPLPVVEFQSDPVILDTLTGVCTMLSTSLAPNWEVLPEENAMIAEAFEIVLDKYMPGVKDNIGVEFGLVLAIGGVVLSRMSAGTPRKIEREAIEGESVQSGSVEPQPIYTDIKDGGTTDLGVK